MNKFLSILFILLLFVLLIGCDSTSSVTQSKIENQVANKYNDSEIFVIPTNYDFESVLEFSDDIFIGRLIGVRRGQNLNDNRTNNNDPLNQLQVSSYIEYEFEIKDVIFSGYNRNPKNIKVYFHDNSVIEEDIGYNPMYNCVFYEGYDYLLPVQITDKAYYKHDVYHISGDMVLSLDNEIAKYSSLQGEHSIITKEGNDLTQVVNKDEVITYVKKLVENKEQQKSYIGETDIFKIAGFSSNIFKIKVKDLVQTRKNDVVFCETYTIEILEVIKGNNNYESKELKVNFIGGSIRSGDIIHVGLHNGKQRHDESGIYFNLSSKLIFSLEDINKIKQQLGKS